MDEFVVVAFREGRPVREEYVATAEEAERTAARWKEAGLNANWSRRDEWERLEASFGGRKPQSHLPLRQAAFEDGLASARPHEYRASEDAIVRAAQAFQAGKLDEGFDLLWEEREAARLASDDRRLRELRDFMYEARERLPRPARHQADVLISYLPRKPGLRKRHPVLFGLGVAVVALAAAGGVAAVKYATRSQPSLSGSIVTVNCSEFVLKRNIDTGRYTYQALSADDDASNPGMTEQGWVNAQCTYSEVTGQPGPTIVAKIVPAG